MWVKVKRIRREVEKVEDIGMSDQMFQNQMEERKFEHLKYYKNMMDVQNKRVPNLLGMIGELYSKNKKTMIANAHFNNNYRHKGLLRRYRKIINEEKKVEWRRELKEIKEIERLRD